MFEEVSFKVSFEGGEGRAVTESKRKRIPDLDSREAKRHIYITYLSKGVGRSGENKTLYIYRNQ